MIFKREVLEQIASGEVTLAFRRWKRPSIRQGGTLRTAIGVLAIDSVDRVSEIPELDVRLAGATSREALMSGLRSEGDLYRVTFHVLGPDERIALADSTQDIEQTLVALDRLDQKGAWTRDYLRLIDLNPGIKASQLAMDAGLDTARFKTRVRALKNHGLTHSLTVGYRITVRGAEVLRRSST